MGTNRWIIPGVILATFALVVLVIVVCTKWGLIGAFAIAGGAFTLAAAALATMKPPENW